MKKFVSAILAIILLSLSLFGCAEKDGKTVTVAASSVPHAKILEQCVTAMKEKGYTLKIKVMDDYVIPNTATQDGEVDANFFQHTPYLEQFNEENKTTLVSVAKVHYEPYALYAGTASSLADIPNGAKIAIPNDVTNGARALLLLEAAGIITLKTGADLTATKNDITKNPKHIEILEIEAALLPNQLDEVAAAVINGNYAISAGLDIKNALAVESSDSTAAQTFANILVVKKGNENNEGIKALVEILKSDAVKDFINDTYSGAVVPVN